MFRQFWANEGCLNYGPTDKTGIVPRTKEAKIKPRSVRKGVKDHGGTRWTGDIWRYGAGVGGEKEQNL